MAEADAPVVRASAKYLRVAPRKVRVVADQVRGMAMPDAISLLSFSTRGPAHEVQKLLESAAANAENNPELIGQFGVGFYSAFLVADKVEVVTQAAGEEQAWRWISDATDGYTIEEAEREGRGTSIVLHLKEEQRKYLQPWAIRELVSRYADYVSHPIELPAPPENEEDEEAPGRRRI